MIWPNLNLFDLPQRALAILRQADEPLGAGQLANRLWCPPKAASETVEHLARKGLLQAHTDWKNPEATVNLAPQRQGEIDTYLKAALKEHAVLGQLYFAYGSNLNPERMQNRGIEPRFVARARAPGYVTGFPRSSREGGGVAGLIPSAKETAEGALYLVTDDDLTALDFYEEVPRSYHRAPLLVSVTLGSGRRAALPRLCVITYGALPGVAAVPSRDYLDHIIKGARYWGLSQEWIASLEQIGGQSSERDAGNLPLAQRGRRGRRHHTLSPRNRNRRRPARRRR